MAFDPLYLIIVLSVILVSMTLHEAMHAFMGYWLGDDTAKAHGRLSLNPIKHIDPIMTIGLPVVLLLTGQPIFGGAKPVPFNPMNVRYGEFGAALVAIAGPLTNLILAFFGFLVMAFLQLEGLSLMILQTFVIVNIGFFAFNILPIPPLDGSRVLYAIAPDGARRVMEVIEQYGLFVIFAIVLLFNQQLGQVLYAIITTVLTLFETIVGL